MNRSTQKCEIILNGKVIWTGVNEIVVGPATETILDVNFEGVNDEVVIFFNPTLGEPHRENGK